MGKEIYDEQMYHGPATGFYDMSKFTEALESQPDVVMTNKDSGPDVARTRTSRTFLFVENGVQVTYRWTMLYKEPEATVILSGKPANRSGAKGRLEILADAYSLKEQTTGQETQKDTA